MNQEALGKLIHELDLAIPKEDARITLSQYGSDINEAMVIGNQRGYLRLGVELLKAAFAPPSKQVERDPYAIDVEVNYILTSDSDIQFDWFQRRDDVPAAGEGKETWKDKMIGWGCLAALVLILILALIGLRSVGQWLFQR